MVRFRDVLFKNKNFTLLWVAQVIANFGDRLSQMALIALVYHTAPGSAIALAKVLSFTIIPVFVIGPIAGAWVDRLDKREVMIMSDVARGFLALFIPLFIIMHKMLPIYLIIFLIYSVARFSIPSRMAIIPELVEKQELLVANSLSDTTKMIGTAIGVVVAGLIVNIRSIGAIGGFFIYSLSFFVSAVLMGMIVKKEFLSHIRKDLIEATHAIEESIRKSIFAEIKDGVGFMFKYGDMRFVLVVFSFLMAGIGAAYCVSITYVQDVFGNATKDLSLLILYLLVGLFLGTVFYGRFAQKASKKKSISLSFISTGIAMALFTAAIKNYPSILVGGILALLMGLCASPIMVSANTLAHEVMPSAIRGKVFSSLEAVIHLAFLVFMFATGLLSKYVGKGKILIGCGAMLALFGICALVLEMRRRPTGD